MWTGFIRALRSLRRGRGFAAFSIATLAIGIGSATAVFSIVQAVLVRDLPFAAPDRLVWMYNLRTERDRAPISIADLEDYARRSSLVDGFAPFTNWTANLTGVADAERIEGTRVAGNFFAVVGTTPWLGRTIEPADEAEGRVVMLTYGLWLRRFGGDATVVGRSIALNGAAHTVVGVLPPGFLFPFRAAELAVPLSLRDDPRRSDRGANFLRVVARLKPDVRIAQAKSELDAIARQLQQQYPVEDARKIGISLYPLHSEIVGDYSTTLWTMFATVAILLLVACGNLANLSLARATARSGELALRTALGASPRQIVGLLAAESAVVAAIGGAAGLLVARLMLDAWRVLAPPAFPRMGDVRIDSGIVAFAVALSVGAALVAGLLPALAVARSPAMSIQAGGRTTTGDRRLGRVRRSFVALQVAGSACLLVCMALAARGFSTLERVDVGFSRSQALSIQLTLPPNRYVDRQSLVTFAAALDERTRAIAGVQAAGAVSLLPLSGLLSIVDISLPDRPAPPLDQVPQAQLRVATPDYFSAAGISISEGRAFSPHDTSDGRLVAIVSRTLAGRHWPGASPIGKTIRLVTSRPSPPMEIVGVAADVKQYDISGAATADLYVPLRQVPASQVPLLAARLYYVVRASNDPRTLSQSLTAAVRSVDPDVAASSIRTLEEVWAASLGSRRVSLRTLETFGQVAMMLAAIGVYAVASFAAGARRRELAVRTAFGASRRELIRLMIVGELPAVVAGLLLGLPAAVVAAKLLDASPAATAASDSAIYVAAAAVMLGLSVTAAVVPAARASRSDPVELLRS